MARAMVQAVKNLVSEHDSGSQDVCKAVSSRVFFMGLQDI